MNQPPPGEMPIVRSDDGSLLLRPLAETDITERYLSWFRDEAVTLHLDARDLTAEAVREYLRWGLETRKRYIYAICVADSGLHIGNLKIGDIDWKPSVSDLVTVIGDRDHWGLGIASKAIRLGSKLAFDHFDIRKLNGAINTKAGPTDRVVISCFNPKYFIALPTFPLPLPKV
jgi:[ribosomal protein S5]-alanine N-acetyltransferase